MIMNHNIECTFPNEHFAWSSCDPHGMLNERFFLLAISSSSGAGFHQDPYCNIYHPHQEQVFIIRIHIAIFIILIRSSFSSGPILQYLSSSSAASAEGQAWKLLLEWCSYPGPAVILNIYDTSYGQAEPSS